MNQFLISGVVELSASLVRSSANLADTKSSTKWSRWKRHKRSTSEARTHNCWRRLWTIRGDERLVQSTPLGGCSGLPRGRRKELQRSPISRSVSSLPHRSLIFHYVSHGSNWKSLDESIFTAADQMNSNKSPAPQYRGGRREVGEWVVPPSYQICFTQMRPHAHLPLYVHGHKGIFYF